MAAFNRDDDLFVEAKRLGGVSLENLVSRADWGAYNFAEVEQELQLMVKFAQVIETVDEHFLTKRLRDDLRSYLAAVHSTFAEIEGFNIRDPANVHERHPEAIRRIRQTADNLAEKGLPLLGGTTRLQVPTAPISDLAWEGYRNQLHQAEKATEAAQEAVAAINEEGEKFKKLSKEAEGVAVTFKQASARLGVAFHEGDFSDEVTRLGRLRLGWLAISALLLAATIAAAFELTERLPVTDSYIRMAQHLITKVFIVGALGAATVWSGSNYRALSHQLTINRHRMNALRTFKRFVEAAETSEVRQAILLETMRTIFGPTATGFLPTGSDAVPDGTGKLLEALLKSGGKSGGA